ncbi:hypothetical protein [Caudoviricetes sp.]|nr:hypothetical protein [Caudoviricetes sp.]
MMISMITTMDAFRRELTKLIDDRRKSIIENVTSGLAITSMEQYREHVGRLSEQVEILDLMDEAEANVRKR